MNSNGDYQQRNTNQLVTINRGSRLGEMERRELMARGISFLKERNMDYHPIYGFYYNLGYNRNCERDKSDEI
jgi:hypothetical protein